MKHEKFYVIILKYLKKHTLNLQKLLSTNLIIFFNILKESHRIFPVPFVSVANYY